MKFFMVKILINSLLNEVLLKLTFNFGNFLIGAGGSWNARESRTPEQKSTNMFIRALNKGYFRKLCCYNQEVRSG
jgi:hypothetical protein